MKRLIALTAAALLASPAAAFAKGPIEDASACGSDGCTAVVLPPEAKRQDGIRLVFGTAPTTAPAPGEYYRLNISMGPEKLALFYKDGVATEGSSTTWSSVSEPLRSAIDRALAGHSAYRYEISGVLVDGRRSGHPKAFMGMFGSLPPAAADSRLISRHAERWVPIQVVGQTPWTSLTVYYDPPTGSISAISSGSQWLQAPASVRTEVDRMVGHTGGTASSPDDWPGWPLWAGLAVALALAGATVAAWLRRRSRPRPARIA
jgi:hypothetical protein